jgi:hypothetical protein
MRNGQNKRMRGRNRKSQNPLTRVYESNGPDVKIRGTASHIAEKYIQLARDAQSSGDPVGAEAYYQHAEHYFRMIAAAQEQFRQSQPFYRQDGEYQQQPREESFGDDDDDTSPVAGGEPSYGQQQYAPREGNPYPAREPQPYMPREGQPFNAREGQQQQGRPQHGAPDAGGDVERLPSFITGSSQPQAQGHGSNGHDNQPDRFPLHRRRRRHRGPRSDVGGNQPGFEDSGRSGGD